MLSRVLIAALAATTFAQSMDGTPADGMEPMPTDAADAMPSDSMPTDGADTGIPTVMLKFPAASTATYDSTALVTVTSCPPGVTDCPAVKNKAAELPCTKEHAAANTTMPPPPPPPVKAKFVVATKPCPCESEAEATSEAPVWAANGTAATSAPVVVAASARSTGSIIAVLAVAFAVTMM